MELYIVESVEGQTVGIYSSMSLAQDYIDSREDSWAYVIIVTTLDSELSLY